MIYNLKRRILLMITITTLVFMTTCVVLASADSNDIAGKRICIDPGHGGSDPGATSNGLKEKDVNLNVALRLKELLVSKGAIPVLTREDDSKPSHPKRWKIANDNNCEIFIAIHCNANQKTAPRGTEVYYYPKDIPTNTLAQKVYENVVSYLDTKGDRSDPIKYAQGTNSYGVLGAAYNGGKHIPAINVELAFISNPGDNKKLASPEYQQKAANAILNGLQSLSINSAPPGLPTSLTQYKSDGVTGITVGGTTTESTVIMKGGVSDPSGNTVKLEVEVEPVGSPSFTGTPTGSVAKNHNIKEKI
jgi:N-acetylmuramoyl-L-alanine amidase